MRGAALDPADVVDRERRRRVVVGDRPGALRVGDRRSTGLERLTLNVSPGSSRASWLEGDGRLGRLAGGEDHLARLVV